MKKKKVTPFIQLFRLLQTDEQKTILYETIEPLKDDYRDDFCLACVAYIRFGIRSTSVPSVNEVSTRLISSRRVIFTPCSDIRKELASTPINEGAASGQRATGFLDCVRLLRRPVVALSFAGIVCHVGIDVGTNATAPKLLMERLGMGLDDAAFAASLYFAFRTIGSLTGALLLRVVKGRTFFALSVAMMLAAMAGMAWGSTPAVLYAAIALVGYGNSNIFPMIFAEALRSDADHGNEVSGLMVMGLAGGALFPLVMGVASDAVGQIGAVGVMAIGVAYLFSYIGRISG